MIPSPDRAAIRALARRSETDIVADLRSALAASSASVAAVTQRGLELIRKAKADGERETLSGVCTAMEDWLYDDGMDVEKTVYEAKLKELGLLEMLMEDYDDEDELEGEDSIVIEDAESPADVDVEEPQKALTQFKTLFDQQVRETPVGRRYQTRLEETERLLDEALSLNVDEEVAAPAAAATAAASN